MIKEVSLFARRPDLTPAAFRYHYENQHVPLALRYNRVFVKYTRNHLAGKRLDDPVFDTLTEIWYRNQTEASQAWADYARYHEIVEDERKFMDRTRIISLQTTESVVAGPGRAVEADIVPKHIVLLRRPAGIDATEFAENAAAFARHAAEMTAPVRVTLDLTVASLEVPAIGAALKAGPDAIVSVWVGRDRIRSRSLVPAHGVEVIGAVDVEQFESPTADLHD